MSSGSIIFVHGTGARLRGYQSTFEQIKDLAAKNGITQTFIECAWGDPLGVTFDGLSLPAGPSEDQQAAIDEDLARWIWLFDDPLYELSTLTIRDTSQVRAPSLPPGVKPAWKKLWDEVTAKPPGEELLLLLRRGGLDAYWPEAWTHITKRSPIAEKAFKASAHELPDVCRALGRAVIAELHVRAVQAGGSGPSRQLREALLDRLITDWGQRVFGLGAFLGNLFARAATPIVRHYRAGLSAGSALQIGDILLYQGRGQSIRDFIRKKIENAEPPVTLVAHSLGGIACFDLLALPNPPAVSHLVTTGSQAPLLFELGALSSLQPVPGQVPPYDLPPGFPPWLNIYDQDDFLSYVGERLLKGVRDLKFSSGQPFPDSHSGYFGDEEFWKAVAKFSAP